MEPVVIRDKMVVDTTKFSSDIRIDIQLYLGELTPKHLLEFSSERDWISDKLD